MFMFCENNIFRYCIPIFFKYYNMNSNEAQICLNVMDNKTVVSLHVFPLLLMSIHTIILYFTMTCTI